MKDKNVKNDHSEAIIECSYWYERDYFDKLAGSSQWYFIGADLYLNI